MAWIEKNYKDDRDKIVQDHIGFVCNLFSGRNVALHLYDV